MLENAGIPHQFIPPQNFEMCQNGMRKYGTSAGHKQPIFNDDDQEQDDDEASDDEEMMQSGEEDPTNPEEEYDDSEEAEDEDYPYDNSDPDDEAQILKNGHSIESSNSSP